MERFVLAVDIGKEVFRPFRKVQYCLEVDDFSAGGSYYRSVLLPAKVLNIPLTVA